MTDSLSVMLGLGLFGVGCLAFTEKILPAPPSHVLLLFLGMTAAPDLTTLGVLLAVTTLGSTIGCLFWFAMGGRLGPDRADALVCRYGRYIFLHRATYLNFARAYRRHHVRVSLLAQFVPTVRNYLPVAAGALRLPPWPFALATLFGAMSWNAGFLLVGYFMRDSGSDLLAVAFHIIVVVAAVDVLLLLAVRYWRLWWPRSGAVRG